mmetsp:Transcript_33122/g.105570  ORF Transcript_33122/g.105570 Transcript_33122/m.105570 type:complete len:250 (+) Transcript_33122:244-993(+)
MRARGVLLRSTSSKKSTTRKRKSATAEKKCHTVREARVRVYVETATQDPLLLCGDSYPGSPSTRNGHVFSSTNSQGFGGYPHTVVVVEVPEDDARAVEVHALLGGGTVVAHLDRVEVQGGAPRHRHHRRSPQSPLAHVLPVLQLVGHVGQGGHPHDGPLQVDNPVEEDGLDQRARDGGGEDESVDAADEGDEAPPALHQLAPRRPHQHVPAQHRLLAERQPSQVPPPALEAVLSIPLPVLLPHLLPPPQ